ncbi:MAG TPA: peroxiredoxin [Candidatus Azoamicus sp. OHIO2]
MANLIGNTAIDFTAPAILPDGSIQKDFNFYKHIDKKYCLLFFYPMDFTFVCPSELIALNNRINVFKKRHIEIIAISIDSIFVHKAWRNTPITSGGIGTLSYCLISDIKKNIIKSYGVEDQNTGVSYRGSFIIDDKKVVRVQHIHDFPIGRNIDEYIRLFDALDFHAKNGEVCQAGWMKGNTGIKPSTEGISAFLSANSTIL